MGGEIDGEGEIVAKPLHIMSASRSRFSLARANSPSRKSSLVRVIGAVLPWRRSYSSYARARTTASTTRWREAKSAELCAPKTVYRAKPISTVGSFPELSSLDTTDLLLKPIIKASSSCVNPQRRRCARTCEVNFFCIQKVGCAVVTNERRIKLTA